MDDIVGIKTRREGIETVSVKNINISTIVGIKTRREGIETTKMPKIANIASRN